MSTNKSPVSKPPLTNTKKDVSLVDIMNTLKIMRNEIQSINSKLLTQENTSTAILNRMDTLSTEIISLKNENAELKRDIEKLKTNSLEHTCSSNTANSIPGFDFVKEIQEREIKSRNILLFNVVESQDDEMKLATDLIKSLHIDVPSLQLFVLESSRINRDLLESNLSVLIGDFNLPGIKWSNQTHAILSGHSSDKSNVLAETIAYEQFFQHNFIPNYRNNILDLAISDNNTLEVSKCSFPLIPVYVAHPPLQINGPNFVSSLKKPFPSSEPNFRRGNYESMNAYLHNIDWDSLLSDSLDFSVTVSNFYSVIHDAINSFIPKIYIHKNQYPQWYSRKLKSLIYNKKRLHKEFKVTKDPLIYNEFSRLRSLCKRESKL
ncbi:hypothetical protein QTP88_020011, partial [Uroleucon formosanum]